MNYIIYCLESPIDNKIYYVGKSDRGLKRPLKHLYYSNNENVNEWIKTLNNKKPYIKILEIVKNENDLLNKEKFWINKLKNENHPLLNKLYSKEKHLKYIDYQIGDFIREKRKQCKLTQKEFAEKSGVGLKFIRDLEQGKESCRMDKVLYILDMFGATLVPYIKNV